MQRSTVLFLVLVAVLACVALVFGFGGTAESPPLAPGNEPNRAPSPGPDTGDPAGQNPAGQNPATSPDAPHVTVTVTALERFSAPPRQYALARRADGVVLPTRVLAGVGSGFDTGSLQRGSALVAVAFEAGELLRQVAIDPAEIVPAMVGARIVLRGRVVDTEQQPVGAAVVWFGELAADGQPRTAAVDDDGHFEFDAPAGQGVPFVVRADGFASSWRTITVAGRPAALPVILQPAGRLQVQIAARALSMEQARVFVVPRAKVSTELSLWPFFQQVLSDGYAIDERGRAHIDDLPQQGQLAVIVRHPFAPLAAPTTVTLDGASSRVVVQMQFSATTRNGAVVDDRGLALAGVSIWARSPGQSLGASGSLRLLPPHMDARNTCYAISDAAGRFTIGAPPTQADGQERVLTLRALGHAGREVAFEGHFDDAIVLPTWHGGEACLRVSPPVADKSWTVASNLGGGVRANCQANEVWQLALPHAGRFDVQVSVTIDGEVKAKQIWSDQHATGPVDIATPSPN